MTCTGTQKNACKPTRLSVVYSVVNDVRVPIILWWFPKQQYIT